MIELIKPSNCHQELAIECIKGSPKETSNYLQVANRSKPNKNTVKS